MAKLQELTCNPLNIRYVSANKWKGQCGQCQGFARFRNEAYGFRAAYKLICNYIKAGHDTIEKIVSRWAPPCENNTSAYIAFVEDEIMIDRNQLLFNVSIKDYWIIIEILRAMAKMECGKWYDHQQINLYINYPEKF